ncbi:xanthine dehydrogenase family protein molybdopterin-binding subunit, partial [Rhizobiaceae sp. 2RAB30]
MSAAAARWNVPAKRIVVRDGIVSDPASGQSARFGELVEAAARLPAPHGVPLKQPGEWRIAGTSPGRLDIPAKTDGSFGYGIDLKLPDMLHAALRSAPVHGGQLVDVDLALAKKMPGVVDVLRLDNAVAVIASSWWQARRAVEALEPRFSDGGAAVLDGDALRDEQDRALSASDWTDMVEVGKAAEIFEGTAETRRITATYRVPYLHHAAMEPINVTARFADGRLTVWG